MQRHRRAVWVLGMLIIIGLVFFPAIGRAEEKNGSATAKKTLTREDDFVVIYGRQIKNNLNKKITLLGLFAAENGKVIPIPFQVDEITGDGEWVLPNVPPYLKKATIRVDQDDDKGLLDHNDELVFMIKDSGDRVGKEAMPPGTLAVDEIMLVDPVDQGKAWVYLCAFAANPPRSQVDYVNYVFPADRVVTTNFELGFSHQVPISWDYLSFRGMHNMVDRMKLRFNFTLFGVPYYLDENRFNSALSLYKDGPVRVIRRVRSSIQINKLLRTPSAASESIYYYNSIVIPFRIKIPVSPRPFKRFVNIKMHGGMDMQNLHGWRLKADTDPRWMNIDGTMDQIEKSIAGEGANAMVLAGPPGAMMVRMILNRNPDGSPQKLPIKTKIYYVDDDATPDPPEFIPGQSPHIGYWMSGFEDLAQGTFYFYLISYMIRDYQEGAEIKYMNIIDRMVKSQVNPL